LDGIAMEHTINITREDLKAPRHGVRWPLLATRPDLLPQALFTAQVIAQRLAHVARDSFRGAATPAQLGELATLVLVRADARVDEVEAFLRLGDGGLALVDAGHNHVRIEVAAETSDTARRGARMLRDALALAPTAPERISVAFWMRGEMGGEVRHRQIDAPTFEEIAANYSSAVRDALAQLVETRAPERGRLILWRGEPGTGKSHALRALARAWAPWCSAHFIMDPEELLGRGGAYILDLLTWEEGDEEKWRLLILEDAGELIASDARAITGQALSRLLNVADGLLGQGTRTLLLITTNEPVKRLHPATRRPGRCLADIEFTALSTDEANAWLAARGHDRQVQNPTSLAELYGGDAGGPLTTEAGGSEGFGFARALGTEGQR
jgi:hypothetical protein